MVTILNHETKLIVRFTQKMLQINKYEHAINDRRKINSIDTQIL